jgi:uncharacterized RDD family membrane protein YckC
MTRFDVDWEGKKPAPPWKRILSILLDFLILLPPVVLVAGKHDFVPFPGVSLTYWILVSLWGWYTFLFGIGLPLYKGVCSIGDIILKLGVTDLEGRKITKLRMVSRQLVICSLLFWMLLPSFLFAGIVVNIILYSNIFWKEKRKKTYMHSVDRLFQTTVMIVEFKKAEANSGG